MNNKTLFLTIGAAAIVMAVGTMIDESQQASSEFNSSLMLPELAAQASQLQQIKIESAGDTLVVDSQKSGEQWVINNMDGYTAQTSQLADLIGQLKEAKKLEAKTTKAELFHHLGLRDISDEDSKAMLITLVAGDQTHQLLVGDTAKNGKGQYVRLAGEQQTWLIDQSISKPETAKDWIKTKLFDFSMNDIKRIELTGKYSYQLSKADQEQGNFSLDQLPDDHQLKYESVVDMIPRAVSNLKFDDLLKRDQLPELTDSQNLAVTLFSDESVVNLTVAKASKASEDEQTKYYAQLNGSDPLWEQWAYEISEYHYNQLAKDKMAHLDEKSAPADPVAPVAPVVPVKSDEPLTAEPPK